MLMENLELRKKIYEERITECKNNISKNNEFISAFIKQNKELNKTIKEYRKEIDQLQTNKK